MELFNSLKSRLESYEKPFTHWAISKPLTDLAIKELFVMQILQIQFLRELVMMELEQLMVERVNLEKVLNREEKQKNIDVLLQKKIQKIFQNLQNL